ncbi:hypothetical protein ACWCOW_43170, partial [Streptomyces sp. NPDC001939]
GRSRVSSIVTMCLPQAQRVLRVAVYALHACLRRRNANARHRDVLAAERKERARIRCERGIRWVGRPPSRRCDRRR